MIHNNYKILFLKNDFSWLLHFDVAGRPATLKMKTCSRVKTCFSTFYVAGRPATLIYVAFFELLHFLFFVILCRGPARDMECDFS